MPDEFNLPDDIQTAFRRMTVEEGRRAATLISDDALRQVCVELADDLDASGEWNLGHQLLGVTTVDAQLHHEGLDADALMDALGLANAPNADAIRETFTEGYAIDAGGVHGALAVVLLRTLEGHPWDKLLGYEAPDHIAAVITVQEAWVTDTSGKTDGRRGPDGRVETRMVAAAARTGTQVQVLSYRDGGRDVYVMAPDVAGLPLDAPARTRLARERQGGGAVSALGGRVLGAMQRSLGVPATPLTERPWRLLGNWWAEKVRASWNQIVGAQGGEAAAWAALKLRPDFLVANHLMTLERVARHLDAAGLDPSDDGDSPEARAALADLEVDHLVDLIRLECEEAGSHEPLAAAQKEITNGMTHDAHAAFDSVARLVWALQADRSQLDAVPRSWWDANQYLMDTDVPLVANSSALRQVNGLSRTPGWFKDSNRRFIKWVESARVPPFPNPNVAAD